MIDQQIEERAVGQIANLTYGWHRVTVQSSELDVPQSVYSC